MRTWQVYYQNNGNGEKWIHWVSSTLAGAEVCYRERVEAHTEAGAFPDSNNITICHKPKKGDIAGFYAKGERISSLAPREWKMYWGLREVETENKLD